MQRAGWQVWSYRWSAVTSTGNARPIPEELLFGGKVFASRKDAESAWYDTCPGCNDKAVYLRATEVN